MSNIDVDPRWVDAQVQAYHDRRADYVAHASFLAAVLRWIATPICPQAMVQARAKTVASFAGKIIRRVHLMGQMPSDEKMQYELTPDLSAGRVIVHLRREVQAVEQRLLTVVNPTFRRDAEAELAEDQFGYGSTHCIGTLRVEALQKQGFFEATGFSLDEAKRLSPISCESQMRTLAQHVWGEFVHDRQYKSDFVLPRVWARHSYRVAAVMEGVDETLEQIVTGLSQLETNVGRYLEPKEAEAELQRLEAIAKWADDDEKLLARLVRIEIRLGRYESVIDRLRKRAHLTPRLQSELGYALYCRRDASASDRTLGYAMLQASADADPHVETLTRLAQLSDAEPREVRRLWQQAYLSRPTDPKALAGFLRHEMAYSHHATVSQLLKPNIDTAIPILTQQVELKINLPDALYLLAEFHLMQDRPYDALYCLCQAISKTPRNDAGLRILTTVHDELRWMHDIVPEPPGLNWCLQTASLALAIYQAADGPIELPNDLRKLAGAPVESPVIFVAGGTDASVPLDQYDELIGAALADFRGTVGSGGTRAGISQAVGNAIERSNRRLRGFAWLPGGGLPHGVQADERYTDLRKSESGPADFTPAEPLRLWITALASGIRPSQIKLFGMNGGRIAAFEYRLAAALGAEVGIVRSSGREADRLLLQEDQPGNETIRFLPADAEVLRAFVNYPFRSGFPDDDLRKLAVQADAAYHALLHEQTRDDWEEKVRGDPSLSRAFASSNVDQVEHIQLKLARIGKHAVRREGKVVNAPFTPDQEQLLAEMEHGRWVVERTLAGWRLGPRDDEAHRRPSLVAWNDPALSADEREKDLVAVRAIPGMLAAAGYAIEDARA